MHMYHIFTQLLSGVSIVFICFHAISYTPYFLKHFSIDHYGKTDKLSFALLFASFAIFDILWNTYFGVEIINLAFIYLIIIAFFLKSIVHIFVFDFIVLAFFWGTGNKLDTLSFFTCFYLTLSFAAYIFSKYALSRRYLHWHTLFFAFVTSASYAIGLSLFSNTANIRVEEYLFVITFLGTIGCVSFIKTFEDIIKETEHWEGTTAKVALEIINQSLPLLQVGLIEDQASAISHIMLKNISSFDFVAIVDRNNILSLIANEDEPQFINYLENDIHNIIKNNYSHSGPFHVIYSYAYGFLNINKNLQGAIITGHITKRYVTAFEENIVVSVANMISQQLRVYNLNQIEKNLAITEIKALQSQINAHFLFNALNTISYYCSSNPDTAKSLITHLANYFRSNISTNERLISITKELQHVNAYLQIELARYGDQLVVEYDVDDETNFMLPPFTMQPIVENTIKHGLRGHVEHGKIRIIIKASCHCFHLYVIDNGVGMSKEKIRSITKPNNVSIGLYNVNQRLISYYGQEYALMITSRLGKGTIVHVRIPKEERHD